MNALRPHPHPRAPSLTAPHPAAPPHIPSPAQGVLVTRCGNGLRLLGVPEGAPAGVGVAQTFLPAPALGGYTALAVSPTAK